MYNLDLSILYFFNQTIASPALDVAFDLLTNVRYWFPVYVIGALWLIYRAKDRRSALLLVLGAVALVAFSDSLSHYFLKPGFGRMRPCATLAVGSPLIDWIRLPVGRKLDPSLPSNHAMNNMAVAIYFFVCYRRKALWLIVVAVLIGLGRIYEGVHYPSDVLAGFLIGGAIGYGWYVLVWRVLLPNRFPQRVRIDRRMDSSGLA
jgi:undecaprenyl-diphosphatase